MKKRSLLFKLIIINAIILGFALIFLALILSMWFKENFFSEKRIQFQKTGINLCRTININNEEDLFKSSIRSEIENLIDVTSDYVDSNIILYNRNNDIVSYSKGSEEIIYSNKIQLSEDNMNSLSRGNYIEYIDDYYTYIYPINSEDELLGYIMMNTPVSIINGQLRKIYLIIWISSLCTMVFSILILTLFAKTILINPLAAINNAAKKFASGEVDKRVSIKSRDEIGELAKSFNIMAESLEKVENNRREFISNVSHELRSPITSIKGFIAGIIDGVIPKDKEDYYLHRVYSEIQRLTRLISDLLDLSAIESGKLKFNIRKFELNELIRICIINSEGKIKDKNITLSAKFHSEKCYVDADEDRIIQVITNILDNAIKYCGENGIIKVKVCSKGSKVFVSVYNDGPKLTHEELIHIWDRFYKSDKSRTNKVSTGLGLPIVRMILKEQGEEIWVKNDKEKGVSFIFSLSKSIIKKSITKVNKNFNIHI